MEISIETKEEKVYTFTLKALHDILGDMLKDIDGDTGIAFSNGESLQLINKAYLAKHASEAIELVILTHK